MRTGVWREPVSIRFPPPVWVFPSAHMCKKQRFGPPVYTSLVGVPPRLDSATLVKSSFVFDALAAESVQNAPFSGAAAEKDVASEARNAPVPGWPGASKTVCFPLFLKNEIHPGSASRKFSKSWAGPKVLNFVLMLRQALNLRFN